MNERLHRAGADSQRMYRRVVFICLVSAILWSACDADTISTPAVPTSCSMIGAQCQRPEGPLGVCQETRCAAGALPPCFTCTSQH